MFIYFMSGIICEKRIIIFFSYRKSSGFREKNGLVIVIERRVELGFGRFVYGRSSFEFFICVIIVVVEGVCMFFRWGWGGKRNR